MAALLLLKVRVKVGDVNAPCLIFERFHYAGGGARAMRQTNSQHAVEVRHLGRRQRTRSGAENHSEDRLRLLETLSKNKDVLKRRQNVLIS